MSFNKIRRQRDPFGPRFGELMGKHCHQAITAASRGKREEFDRLVKDLYQMLDSIETETDWPEEKKVEKKDEPTTVAPETKRVTKSAGNKKPAKQRAKKATKLSDGFGDND
jgi:tRNA U34 5-carboxymethylaminomethyl modifying GTPase MnmE/TrmE